VIAGDDVLEGGAGKDRFAHLFDYDPWSLDDTAAGNDRITDFEGCRHHRTTADFVPLNEDDPLPVWQLDFGDLDSNGNRVLDEGIGLSASRRSRTEAGPCRRPCSAPAACSTPPTRARPSIGGHPP